MIIIEIDRMRRLLLYFILAGTMSFLAGYVHGELMTPSPTVQKYSGLFMPISEQNSHLFFLLLPGQAVVKEDQRVKLDDEEFAQAIKETENRRIYQIRSRGGMLTHTCLDALQGQNELRYLDLSNNRLISDLACKKIAEYFPRLERLNLFNTSISNKGLIYLMDLANLKQLHVAQTKVTWAEANLFRGKMQAIAGNEDLEITTGYNKPSLLSYNLIKRLRATYQTNTYNGMLNPNFKVEVSGGEVKENKKYDEDDKAEDDAKRSQTDPVLKQ